MIVNKALIWKFNEKTVCLIQMLAGAVSKKRDTETGRSIEH